MRKTLLATAAATLAAAALVLGLTQPAAAQDAYRWSGFYVGAHSGWAGADIGFPDAPAHPAGPPRQSLDGAVIGGQVGYNWQLHSLVLGVEADVSWGNLSGTVRDGNYITQTDTIDWSGSVRGRLGYAFGAFLPYLTAGMMWDRGERGQQCPDPAAVPFGHCNKANGYAPYNLSNTQTHEGFVWGGGLEYAIAQRWSIRLEALHADMGAETYTLGPTPSGKTLGSGRIEHEVTTVRLGVNVKLD